jgi:cytochrome P450
MIRAILRRLSYLVVWPLRPLKVYAYRTRFSWIKRLILTFTTPIDFALIWLNVQNETMLLHFRVYGGNFVFGRGIMVTDYVSTAEAVVRPACRGNNFMGVNIVASDSNAFGTNTGILNQCPPIRNSTRAYLDQNIFTPHVRAHTLATVQAEVADILAEWAANPRMATVFVLRTVVTRVFLKLLSGVTVPEPEARSVTIQYIRRFVELSLFSGYLPILLDLLGTHKGVRRDAYFKLKAHGIDLMTIDITLFAAMFSIGTLVIRCVEDALRFDIDYANLDPVRKRHFVIEAVRLYPTVTSVHRIVEQDEMIWLRGKEVKLTPGDEVVYPFICSNRDPAAFANPEQMNLDRPEEEYDRVLSWSKGPHSCPAKELSILVTVLMLDELSRKSDLRALRIWNPAF